MALNVLAECFPSFWVGEKKMTVRELTKINSSGSEKFWVKIEPLDLEPSLMQIDTAWIPPMY